MFPAKIIEENKNKCDIFTIPGSAYHNDDGRVKDYYHLLMSGKATPHSDLLKVDYCKENAAKLYDFIVQHTPASIFKELVKQIIGGDTTCNCYTAELLGMQKQEVFRKAQDVRMGKPAPEKICTKCLTTKPLTEFYKTKIPTKSGGVTPSVQANCIECTLAQQAESRKAEKLKTGEIK